MVWTLETVLDADSTSSHVDKNLGHKERVHAAQLALHVQAIVENVLLGIKIKPDRLLAKLLNAQAVSMNKKGRPLLSQLKRGVSLEQQSQI